MHVWQLTTWPPYPWAPGWLAAYFVSLTLLDPLAGVLLLLRRRSGLVLGAVILTTDAAANGYAVYVLGVSSPAAIVAQAVISGFAVVASGTLPRAWAYCGDKS
ncbi:hypothetical protein J2S43_003714 [Catenuloplanes nepalensis]|uniref:Uncharacterized protein n=1 Tax=Catenuloplanes nepalensis TaxID=587533 RepID=A0ABT9MUS0_9ACTN|nr:hypothetical protein [Catenuloplanes nepalensis]MDP9795202.1 hypothetical protein [Catenuloplanes nepalensis]